MVKRLSPRLVLLVASETILIVLAVVAAAYLRLDSAQWDGFFSQGGVLKALLLAGVAQACLYYADLYDLKRVSETRELFIRVVQALGWASFILAAVYFWFGDPVMVGRGVFTYAALLVIA